MMTNTYQAKRGPAAFWPLPIQLAAIALVFMIASTIMYNVTLQLSRLFPNLFGILTIALMTLLVITTMLIILAAISPLVTQLNSYRVRRQIWLRFASPRYGNHLHLKDGEKLPKIKVHTDNAFGSLDHATIDVYTTTLNQDETSKLSDIITSALRGSLVHLTVTRQSTDATGNFVRFSLEDAKAVHKIHAKSISDLCYNPQLLPIQDNLVINLTTSGSALIAGKTRSGKTTAVLSLLIQILAYGRDDFGSKVVIVDGKGAELSRIPGVHAPAPNGDCHDILDALHSVESTMAQRQQHLDDLLEQTGHLFHWWEADMKPTVLFIDEFVALRTLFPARATKDDPEYSQAEFMNALKRIITMGASVGCFVFLSIAQANANELPTMLRDAFSTRVLMRPTASEARLMWDPEQLQEMPTRIYAPGDAWMTTTDGVHDGQPTLVTFPDLQFPAYQALAELLRRY